MRKNGGRKKRERLAYILYILLQQAQLATIVLLPWEVGGGRWGEYEEEEGQE